MKTLSIKTAILFSVFLIGCAGTRPQLSVSKIPELKNQSTSQPQFETETMSILDQKFQETINYTFIKIPYSGLIFVAADSGGWYAEVTLEDRLMFQGNPIAYNTYPIKTKTFFKYEATKNPHLNLLQILTYKGTPGLYTLDLKVTDRNAPNSSSLRIPISILSIKTNGFDISDPVMAPVGIDPEQFLKILLTPSSSAAAIFPLNSELLDPFQPVNVVFELYIPAHFSLENKEVIAEYHLYPDLYKEAVLEKKQTIEINSESPRRKTIGMELALPEHAGNGQYTLIVQVYVQNKNTGTIEATSTIRAKMLQFYSPIPRSISDFDALINDLKYIADPPHDKVIKKLKKAEREEKKKLYLELWEKRGGRYAMEQFHHRAAYANEHLPAGWMDDRRKVCIRYGTPIDPHTYKVTVLPGHRTGDVAYEIWIYATLPAADPIYFPPASAYYDRKAFIFIDDYGFGQYKFGYRHGGFNRLEYHNNLEFDNY